MRISTFVPVAALGLVVSASLAGVSVPLTTFSFGSAHLQYGSDAGGDPAWVDYTITPNITADGGIDGLHMYSPGEGSTTFNLDSATYQSQSTSIQGNRLFLAGAGTVNGAAWEGSEDFIRTTFGFGVGFGSGTLELSAIITSFTMTDDEGNLVGFSSTATHFSEPFTPGGYNFGGIVFEDRFGDIPTATRISWDVSFYFDWQGMDPGDALHWTISPTSVDFNTLPGPGAAALLGLGGLVAGRRRR